MSKKTEVGTVIIGMGNAGIIAALAYVLSKKTEPLTIIDTAKVPGGSFSSFITDKGARFDRGIHLFPQIFETPFSDYFSSQFGYGDSFWNTLKFPRRDRSGCIINGHIYSDTSLVNINNFNPTLQRTISNEFLQQDGKAFEKCSSAGDFVESNFDLLLKFYKPYN